MNSTAERMGLLPGTPSTPTKVVVFQYLYLVAGPRYVMEWAMYN